MSLVSVIPVDDGMWWRVVFGASKGNILDAALMDALAGVFVEAGRTPALKAIVLEGEGAHFSFGSSVEEHLPEHVAGMLARFHGMLLALLDSSVMVIAAVRGQCLGGGLELATLCHRIVAGRDATFGQPEIALGVFAPVASIALVERIGRPRAEDLCLTGRVIGAEEARTLGLVDEITDAAPSDAAVAWARTHLASRSATTLRLAVRAIRADLVSRLKTGLPVVERLYLDELMQTPDAVEGLRAFLEKRKPRWRRK